jgi:predicted transcriptional regulator
MLLTVVDQWSNTCSIVGKNFTVVKEPCVDQLHPFADKINAIISSKLGSSEDAEKLTRELLAALDKNKLLYYADPGRINLLNSHGRVLIAILEDPGITQRALSVYLNVSESNINKSLRALLKDGIIEKRKEGNRNYYRFNLDSGMMHPDIHRFTQALLPLLAESQAKQQTPHHRPE